MKFKYLLVPALFGLALGSCHKDDDSSEYSDTDPRIRSVYIASWGPLMRKIKDSRHQTCC